MEKEKFMMTSALASSLVDITSTEFSFGLGFWETGVMGKFFVENASFEQAAVMRVGIMAVMIGLYALTSEHQDSLPIKFSYS